jgi:hypothetical protein
LALRFVFRHGLVGSAAVHVQSVIARASILAAVLCTALPAGVCAQAPTPSPSNQGGGDDQEARARAKTLFEGGVAAYEAGRYEEALASFQEAFRVRPHPLVRVNIANCYDKLGKPLEALFHFEQFTAADVGTPEQRKEVSAAVERLRKQVGQVIVRVTPDGAMVTIDGGEQRRTPIVDALSLTSGKHEIEVKLDGYQTVRRSLQVQGGTTTELNLVLARAGEPAPVAAPVPALGPGDQPQVAAPPAAEPEPKPEADPVAAAGESPPEPAPAQVAAPLPTSFWIVGGVSAALLLAGSVTGIVALDAESEFDQAARVHLDPNSSGLARQSAYQQAIDASDRADALALTTDILLLGALAGTAVCVVLALNNAKDDDDDAPTATLAPTVTRHTLGARLSGAF